MRHARLDKTHSLSRQRHSPTHLWPFPSGALWRLLLTAPQRIGELVVIFDDEIDVAFIFDRWRR
jgi:hypothetical protein